jgi:hypothetical protein
MPGPAQLPPLDPAVERLRTSADPRVRGLVHLATSAAHRATLMTRKLELTPNLKEREELKQGIDYQLGVQMACVAGAIALDNVKLTVAMRVVIGLLTKGRPLSFEHDLASHVRDFAEKGDGGKVERCPACSELDPATDGAMHLVSPTCLLCEGSGRANESIVALWNALVPVFRAEGLLAPTWPAPAEVLS